MLNHPQVAFRSCEYCKKWMFGKDGKRLTRRGKPVRRPKGSETPCVSCPKKSPGQAWRHELSRENEKWMDLYWMVQATAGKCLTPQQRSNPIVLQRLGILHQVLSNHEQSTILQALALSRTP